MPTIANKTTRPLSVPLPGGRKLHLGPGKEGQIAPNAVAHAPLKKMLDAGELALTDTGHERDDGPAARIGGRASRGFGGGGGGTRRTGDR